ncbi:unnamed protein product [Microthlaspi erraticum]|uniref:Uncharacterized protein n=1 Tax=Microthlaspi erraticum TaxID=1685480 RepID=A0A6D2HIM3_9BRAS|nr:unnamed protein product [Microthlaspi erraticum]
MAGDLTIAETKPKEGGGPLSIMCPTLTATNYMVWAMRMKMTLKVHEVWDVVETGTHPLDVKKNNMAMALLFQSIPEMLVLQVGGLDTAHKIWEEIKVKHVGADRLKEARLQTLMAEFEQLKMKDTDKIDDFTGKLSEITSQSAALGKSIEEPKLVKKFLNSLPRSKFIHIVASLEQILDLNTTSLVDIVERLKAFEEHTQEIEVDLEG